ncbi:site-specific integrase [Ruficoccus sp. ZRK36]|uniref:site-specific integrase n=1 Tax=Ruficoccus sp. ZRK36 TaxID=2866311 RepID=UPI001C72FA24|nr:site-specific integrase [Ruficoccus sp. ZRK36]QYY35266.1 site-specific integrase [Ruficoccus sp. ZRK36]
MKRRPIFKRTRRVNGKVVESEYYYGRYRVQGGKGYKAVPLETTDYEVAEKRLREFKKVLELRHEGLPIPSHLWGAPTRSVETLLDQYNATLTGKDRSEKHVRDTVNRIRTVTDYCKWESISEISAVGFENWRSSTPMDKRRGIPLGVKTLIEYQNSLSAFCNWLRSLGYLERNPLEFVEKGEMRGNERKLRREWSDEEFETFMELGKPPKRADYRDAVWIIRWTGLRKNEMQTLRWGDVFIDGRKRFLIVRAKNSKNRLEESVPLMRKVVEKLRQMRPADYKPEDRILNYRIPGSEQLRMDLKRCGLQYRNDFGDLDFHALRHTFGYWLAERDVSMTKIQAILRHKDSRTTEKHYVNVPKLAQKMTLAEIFDGPTEEAKALTEDLTNSFGSEGQLQSHCDTRKDESGLLQKLDEKVDSLIQALSGTIGINLKMAARAGIEPAIIVH